MDTLLATALNAGVGYVIYAIKAPQNIVKPYGVYSIINNPRDNHSGGQGTLKNIRYQIDVYADTKSEADSIGADVETNILASTSFIPNIIQSFTKLDDDNEGYKFVLDFTIGKN